MDIKFGLLGRVIDLTTLIGAVAVVLMMVHISVDVVAKYLFGMPMPGTITIVSNYYMIVVAFLPLAFAERRNGHISVEVLTVHMPMPAQRVLNVIGMLFAAAVFGALAWQGWVEAGRARAIGAFEIEQNTKLLTWPARFLLPLGCGLMCVTLLAKVWIALVRGKKQDLDDPYL